VEARIPKNPEASLSTDQKGTRILARTFFTQLRESGYTSNQIIGVATELLELVTENLKESKAIALQPTPESRGDLRPEA
jgi:hypothetical protein